jgi:outer membrane protein assembly factor BamB
MRKYFPAAVPGLCLILTLQPSLAQRGGNDWLTGGFDAQRSNWVRNDAKISVDRLSKPGFELVWKMKMVDAPRQLNSITPPALLDFYISHRGFRTLGFFGTSSNKVVAVDTDLGRLEWDKQLAPPAPAAGATLACPGGMTSTVTRPAGLTYPPVPTGARPAGRSAPKGAVGEPGKGAANLRPFPTTPPPPPAAAKPASGPRVYSPFEPHPELVLTLASDGKLHAHYVANGGEPDAAIPFLPPNANAHGLIVVADVAYAATTNKCGGVDNGIWAVDLKTRKVTTWKTASDIAGTGGPAFAPDGTLYAAAGSQLVALSPGTLEPKAVFKSDGAEFTSSPVVFEYQGKNLIAVKNNKGIIQVFDAATLKSPLAASDESAGDSGALASWQDPTGTRWLLAATTTTIQSWKLTGKDGALTIARAWTSRDLVSPLPPIIVNGVVFALSSGEHRTADTKVTASQRARRSVPAVLYALDAQTGKELWNSGKTITSFVHSGGLAAGGSRVYVGGYDGTQYAFGFPIEH